MNRRERGAKRRSRAARTARASTCALPARLAERGAGGSFDLGIRGARALAQDLLGAAQMATENLIERYVRPEQTRGRRRMPYGYRRRVVYL